MLYGWECLIEKCQFVDAWRLVSVLSQVVRGYCDPDDN